MDSFTTLIKKDCAAYSGMDYKQVRLKHLLIRYIKTPGFKVTCHMRLLKKMSSRKGILYLIERIKYRRLQVKYGIQIGYKLTVGGGFTINHYSGIVIGENFNIRNNTTIGHVDGKTPQIGDNVCVGANATIIGNIKIGNDVMIGAGAVVVKSVNDNDIVAGNPAKVIGSIPKGEHPRI